mmetsp:Transcript_1882/g.7559  ORF Transcript_1882/g.7559 Transcript_1882/m.7559 type:complete len:248 (-) Transcript_1882:1771-2514(-)
MIEHIAMRATARRAQDRPCARRVPGRLRVRAQRASGRPRVSSRASAYEQLCPPNTSAVNLRGPAPGGGEEPVEKALRPLCAVRVRHDHRRAAYHHLPSAAQGARARVVGTHLREAHRPPLGVPAVRRIVRPTAQGIDHLREDARRRLHDNHACVQRSTARGGGQRLAREALRSEQGVERAHEEEIGVDHSHARVLRHTPRTQHEELTPRAAVGTGAKVGEVVGVEGRFFERHVCGYYAHVQPFHRAT